MAEINTIGNKTRDDTMQYPIKVKGTGKCIPALNYIIKHSATRAYGGVKV
jgi:hypothetical protein